MAALSHFFGFLAALIVWAAQRDRSRFVRFQAVQVMAFDLIVSIILFLAVGGMLVVIFGIMALGIGNIALLGSQNNPAAEPFRVFISLMTALPFMTLCIMLPITGILFVVRLIATIQTFQGIDFRYPWLGNLIDQSLEH